MVYFDSVVTLVIRSKGTDIMNLELKCKQLRKDILQEISSIGSGHVGGSLSIVEVLAVLYCKHMNVDPKNPKMEGRDRLIVSKGHAGPAVYAILSDMGYFSKDLLLTLNKPNTILPSHCDMNKTPGIDMTTGSLGQGFSCAVGVAKAHKIRNSSAKIYSIIGDGESQEGQIWEAAMLASHWKLDNLIAFTDCNKLQLDGYTKDICNLEPLSDKWKAFGWDVIDVASGNDCKEVDDAILKAKSSKSTPTMIILNTIKGYGVKFAEQAGISNHSMPVSRESLESAIKELGGDE